MDMHIVTHRLAFAQSSGNPRPYSTGDHLSSKHRACAGVANDI